jgi:hypothetical protein
MYKTGLVALEDLENYTVCVKEENGIRKMHKRNDIDEKLVYVCNISLNYHEDKNAEDDFIIKKDTPCRYIDMMFVPKFYLQ